MRAGVCAFRTQRRCTDGSVLACFPRPPLPRAQRHRSALARHLPHHDRRGVRRPPGRSAEARARRLLGRRVARVGRLRPRLDEPRAARSPRVPGGASLQQRRLEYARKRARCADGGALVVRGGCHSRCALRYSWSRACAVPSSCSAGSEATCIVSNAVSQCRVFCACSPFAFHAHTRASATPRYDANHGSIHHTTHSKHGPKSPSGGGGGGWRVVTRPTRWRRAPAWAQCCASSSRALRPSGPRRRRRERRAWRPRRH
jgi:hypothetical protein